MDKPEQHRYTSSALLSSFFIFWIPGIVMQNLERNNTRYYKIPLTYTAWYPGSMQSVMSFAAALTKRDVRSAVKNILTCRSKPRADDSERESEQYTMRWSERRLGQQWASARSLIMGENSSSQILRIPSEHRLLADATLNHRLNQTELP
mmetsp:Transcript_28430/g.51503  ORF Transcript_28430/g.51503 Transcript_28430/m.51503 type:complete len:149 (+) Transcript_28430:1701-2147(+)